MSVPEHILKKMRSVGLLTEQSTSTPSGYNTKTAETLDRFADEEGVERALVRAIGHQEVRDGNPNAVSPANAQGGMQVIESTGLRFVKPDEWATPDGKMRAGVRYLKYLRDLFGQDNVDQIAAAYHAGEGAVKNAIKTGNRLPHTEDKYVSRARGKAFYTDTDYVPPVVERYKKFKGESQKSNPTINGLESKPSVTPFEETKRVIQGILTGKPEKTANPLPSNTAQQPFTVQPAALPDSSFATTRPRTVEGKPITTDKSRLKVANAFAQKLRVSGTPEEIEEFYNRYNQGDAKIIDFVKGREKEIAKQPKPVRQSGQRSVGVGDVTGDDFVHHLGMNDPREIRNWSPQLRNKAIAAVAKAKAEDQRKRDAGQKDFPVSRSYQNEMRRKIGLGEIIGGTNVNTPLTVPLLPEDMMKTSKAFAPRGLYAPNQLSKENIQASVNETLNTSVPLGKPLTREESARKTQIESLLQKSVNDKGQRLLQYERNKLTTELENLSRKESLSKQNTNAPVLPFEGQINSVMDPRARALGLTLDDIKEMSESRKRAQGKSTLENIVGGQAPRIIARWDKMAANIVQGFGTPIKGSLRGDFVDYFNKRSAIWGDAAEYRPKDEGLFTRISRGVIGGAYNIGNLFTLSTAANVSLPVMMGGEAFVENWDKGAYTASKQAAKAYALGKVFEFAPAIPLGKSAVGQFVGPRLGSGVFGGMSAGALKKFEDPDATAEDIFEEAAKGFVLGLPFKGQRFRDIAANAATKLIRSGYTSERITDVVAPIARYGRAIVKSTDGRATYLLNKTGRKETFARELSAEEGNRYQIDDTKRLVVEVTPKEYDALVDSFGIKSRGRGSLLLNPQPQPEITTGQQPQPASQQSVVTPPAIPAMRRPAVWRSANADIPVFVTGEITDASGNTFVQIEGSNTALPAGEIVYSEQQPVTESADTLEAQLESVRNPASSRVAVLYTDQSTVPTTLDENFARLFSPKGILDVNLDKAETTLGLKTVNDVRKFIKEKGVEPLIGKVEPVADTSKGMAVRTEDAATGSELSTSVVTTPETAEIQAEVDREQFSNTEVNQEVIPTQEAVRKRIEEQNTPTTFKSHKGEFTVEAILQRLDEERKTTPKAGTSFIQRAFGLSHGDAVKVIEIANNRAPQNAQENITENITSNENFITSEVQNAPDVSMVSPPVAEVIGQTAEPNKPAINPTETANVHSTAKALDNPAQTKPIETGDSYRSKTTGEVLEVRSVTSDKVTLGNRGGEGLAKEERALDSFQKEFEKTEHKFSSTQVNLPQKEADEVRALSKRLIPDSDLYIDPNDPSYGREDTPHITVKYGLHTESSEEVRKVVQMSGIPKITAQLGKVSIFPGKGDTPYDVVKLDVTSSDTVNLLKHDLPTLNQSLSESLKVTDTHPKYIPHITLAYVKKGQGKKYVGDSSLEGKELTFDEIEFSSSNGQTTLIKLAERDTIDVTENNGTDVQPEKGTREETKSKETSEPESKQDVTGRDSTAQTETAEVVDRDTERGDRSKQEDIPVATVKEQSATVSTIPKNITSLRTVTQKGKSWFAPDGAEFTGVNAKKRAEIYAKQKSYEGAKVKSWGGGVDTILSVSPGDSSFTYTVENSEGIVRKHQTPIDDSKVVEWATSENADETVSQTTTVSHSNPKIDGQTIVAQTSDGKLIVPNPDNKTGISIIKNQTGETSQSKNPQNVSDIQSDDEQAFNKEISFKSDPDVFVVLHQLKRGNEDNLEILTTKAKEYGISDDALEGIIENARHQRTKEPTRESNKDRTAGRSAEIRKTRSPKSSVIEGEETSVEIPNSNRSYKAKYVVREIEDVYPSHNPFNFEPNPDYYFINDRDYSDSQNKQYKLQIENRSKPDGSEPFKPSIVINDSPTADTGAPIIDEDGNALGGNSRTMILHRVYKADPNGGYGYKDLLIKKASNFGISADEVQSMKKPILVRVVNDDSIESTQKAITDLNAVSTTPLTSKERSIAEGKKLDIETANFITSKLEALGSDSTLNQTLDSYGVDIINRLIEKGVIQASERNILIEGSKVTQDAKQRVENILLGSIFRDLQQLKAASPALRNNLGRIVAPVLRVENSDWDLTEHLQNAFDLLSEAKAKNQTLETIAKQTSMIRTSEYTTEEVALARTLQGGTVQASKPFIKYAAEFENTKHGGGLFGSMSQEEAFHRFFKGTDIAVASGSLFGMPAGNGKNTSLNNPPDLFSDEQESLEDAEINYLENVSKDSGISTSPSTSIDLELSQNPEKGYEKSKVSSRDVIHSYLNILQDMDSSTPIRFGRMTARKALGQYDAKAEVIRLETANDISTASHEVGQALHKIIYGAVQSGNLTGIPLPALKELELLGRLLYGSQKPNGGYKAEGFAEFIRYYLTTDKAKKRAPAMFDYFENTFLPAHSDLQKPLEKAKAKTDEYRKQGAENRALANMVRANFRQRVSEAVAKSQQMIKRLPTDWIDEFTPLLRIARQAEETIGKQLSPGKDPAQIAMFQRGRSHAALDQMINRGMIDIAGNVVGAPLQDAMSIVGSYNKENFANYLWAKHALDMIADDKNPGITKEDAETIVTKYDTPQFQLASQKLYEWRRGVLEYVRQSAPDLGDAIDKMLSKWAHSVPVKRYFGPGEMKPSKFSGKAAGGAGLQKLKGSGRLVKDIFPQILADAEAMLAMAHKRQVLNAIIALSHLEGMGHLIEEVPVSKLPQSVQIDKIAKELEDLGADLSSVDVDEFVTFFIPAQQPKGADPILPIKGTDGKVRWYEIPNELYSTLSGLDLYRLPKAFDILFGMPARALRLGTTGLRASFSLVTNPLRDLPTFFFQTQSSSNMARLTGHWLAAGKEAFDPRRLKGNTEPHLDLFYRLGAEMAQPLGVDTALTRKTAKNLFKGKLFRVVSSPINVLRDVFSLPESIPRVAELKALMTERGLQPDDVLTFDDAVFLGNAAKQVTVDFSAAGSKGKVFNQITTFFNASVQGNRSFFRRAFKGKDPKARRRAWIRGLLYLAVPTLLLWWQNKDEDWYADMDAREKMRFWHIGVPGTNQVLQIPRSQEWGNLFGAIPEIIFDSAYRKDPKEFKEVFGFLFDTATPPIIPTAGRTAYEQLANHIDYFDKPIVPKSEEDLSPDEQYNEYTSLPAKVIGRAVTKAFGPTSRVSKFFGSPRRVDQMIRSIGGGVGADLASLPRSVKQATGQGDRAFQSSDLPVIGRLFMRDGKSAIGSTKLEDFYEALTLSKQKQHSKESEETLDEKHSRRLLDASSNVISALRKQMLATKELKLRGAILKQMNAIAKDVLLGKEVTYSVNNGDSQDVIQAKKEASVTQARVVIERELGVSQDTSDKILMSAEEGNEWIQESTAKAIEQETYSDIRRRSSVPMPPAIENELRKLKELKRWEDLEGFDVNRTISIGRTKYQLTPQEYETLHKEIQEAIYPAIEKLMSNPAYQKLSDEQKLNRIKAISSQARQVPINRFKVQLIKRNKNSVVENSQTETQQVMPSPSPGKRSSGFNFIPRR